MGNPVMRWQILAKNPDQESAFYSKLFGWSVNSDNPLGYRQIDTGSERGIPGGIWPAPPQAPSFVQLFVEVEDVSRALQTAVSLGGRVVIPKSALPQGEEMAVITDLEGIPVALFRPARG